MVFVKQVCDEVILIVRHWFASKKDSVKVFKIYSRIRWDDGYVQCRSSLDGDEIVPQNNIMINPHKNNAFFQQVITYSREDI